MFSAGHRVCRRLSGLAPVCPQWRAPAEAPKRDIARFDSGDDLRNTLMAMLQHLDAGIGRIVETLKREGLWENTLLFFLTDNGGAKAVHAVNTPLRGFKRWNYEGGIRTPWVVSRPARFQGGRSIGLHRRVVFP